MTRSTEKTPHPGFEKRGAARQMLIAAIQLRTLIGYQMPRWDPAVDINEETVT
jgi:hypothetical protein